MIKTIMECFEGCVKQVFRVFSKSIVELKEKTFFG